MATATDDGGVELVKKPNASAAVWEHFGFLPNDKGEPANPTEAIYSICHKKVCARDGNTSNLHSHLRVYHPATYQTVRSTLKNVNQPNQPKIAGSFAKATKYKKDSLRWKECTISISKHIAEGMVSFHTVEKKPFHQMVKTLDPQYELPGRKYFSQTAIPDLYRQVHEEVKASVAGASHYALTTDMWSSRDMTPYMSLTCHYISSDWEQESKCLLTSFFPENHTADNLRDALQAALEEWGLSVDKLSAITTDNGANIAAAVRRLNWPWLNCFVRWP